VGAYLVDKKKRLTKPQIGRGKKKLLCFLFARCKTQKKKIDQVYKRRPKEYLGRERKEEKNN
jgi:hypothetical protein